MARIKLGLAIMKRLSLVMRAAPPRATASGPPSAPSSEGELSDADRERGCHCPGQVARGKIDHKQYN
jgi:hypothetical protein